MSGKQSQAAKMVEMVRKMHGSNLNDEQVTALADKIEYGEIEVSGAHWDGGSAMYEAYHFFADDSIAYLNSDAMEARTLRSKADKQHAQGALDNYNAATAGKDDEETMTDDATTTQDEQQQDASTVCLTKEDGSDEPLCGNDDAGLVSDFSADVTCGECLEKAAAQEAADDSADDATDDDSADDADDKPADEQPAKPKKEKKVSKSKVEFTDEQMALIASEIPDADFDTNKGVMFKTVAQLTGVEHITPAMQRQMVDAGYHATNPRTGKPLHKSWYDKGEYAYYKVFSRVGAARITAE